MTILSYVERLAQANAQARRVALLAILRELNAPWILHREEIEMRKEQVYSVKSVEIAVVNSEQRRLRITAHGVASTPGWSQPELVAAGHPMTNGILSFTFVAVRPRGVVLQVLQPISVTRLIDWPHGLRGVRIHAATNVVEALLR